MYNFELYQCQYYTRKNPKYNEQMQEINNRELYEKHKPKLP